MVAAADSSAGATRLSLYAADQPGLFHRVCAALAAAGANIIDARIHTTRDGMALDNLLLLDGRGRPYADRKLLKRLTDAVERALLASEPPAPPAPPPLGQRDAAFGIAPRVLIAERASSRTTVVEVNARDRPGLLARLAAAIHGVGVQLHSAHIATYGERAVDVFYLTDSAGRKLAAEQAERLRLALLEAAGEGA